MKLSARNQIKGRMVGSRFVASLANPGGNTTGVSQR